MKIFSSLHSCLWWLPWNSPNRMFLLGVWEKSLWNLVHLHHHLTDGRRFYFKFLLVLAIAFPIIIIIISKPQGILYIKPESISERHRTILFTICASDLLFQKNIHFNLSPEFWKFSKNSPSPYDHISTYLYFSSITACSLNTDLVLSQGFWLVWVTLSCTQFSPHLELGDLQLSHELLPFLKYQIENRTILGKINWKKKHIIF